MIWKLRLKTSTSFMSLSKANCLYSRRNSGSTLKLTGFRSLVVEPSGCFWIVRFSCIANPFLGFGEPIPNGFAMEVKS